MSRCAYCKEEATHHGEGEDVCNFHIYPEASNEYKELP